jgi:hypothetical protein
VYEVVSVGVGRLQSDTKEGADVTTGDAAVLADVGEDLCETLFFYCDVVVDALSCLGGNGAIAAAPTTARVRVMIDWNR